MILRTTLCALLLLLGGCSAVYSPEPVGEAPFVVNPAEWDGLWTAPDMGMVVQTLDAKQGLMDVLFIDGNSNRSSTVHLRQSGGWLFASTIDKDAAMLSTEDEGGTVTETPPYGFFRVVNRGETLVLWAPHPDRFRRALERGHLPGRIEQDEGDEYFTVVLGELTEAHYRVITESTEGVLMDWDEPAVFVRVAAGRETTPP